MRLGHERGGGQNRGGGVIPCPTSQKGRGLFTLTGDNTREDSVAVACLAGDRNGNT